MDEYIDIVTNTGKTTGKVALKSEAHKNGWFHNTIHLWLYTAEGEILLQQRSRKKIIYPLLWDVSAAGHINTGESFEDAAIRETYEELGVLLRIKDLKKIGVNKHCTTYANGAIKDNEFHHVFLSKLKVDIKKLEPQEEEVEALKLVTFDEFESLIKNCGNNGHFIATNKAYYQYILNKIKTIVSS
jgi:isopentenyldiphosphate isomerase